MKNINEVIKLLNEGIKFENHNTQFFITKDGIFMMCEFTKDCKYTSFSSIQIFSKRILKFYKTGY